MTDHWSTCSPAATNHPRRIQTIHNTHQHPFQPLTPPFSTPPPRSAHHDVMPSYPRHPWLVRDVLAWPTATDQCLRLPHARAPGHQPIRALFSWDQPSLAASSQPWARGTIPIIFSGDLASYASFSICYTRYIRSLRALTRNLKQQHPLSLQSPHLPFPNNHACSTRNTQCAQGMACPHGAPSHFGTGADQGRRGAILMSSMCMIA